MKNNIEVGIQRIYYVAWAVWIPFLAVTVISNPRDFQSFYWLIFIIGLGVVAPLAIMLATRWIYRGFTPKQGSED